MENERIGLVVASVGRTGVLHQLTGVIARHEGDITSVEILGNWPDEARKRHLLRMWMFDEDGRPVPKAQREGRSGRGIRLKGVPLVAPLDVHQLA